MHIVLLTLWSRSQLCSQKLYHSPYLFHLSSDRAALNLQRAESEIKSRLKEPKHYILTVQHNTCTNETTVQAVSYGSLALKWHKGSVNSSPHTSTHLQRKDCTLRQNFHSYTTPESLPLVGSSADKAKLQCWRAKETLHAFTSMSEVFISGTEKKISLI